MGCRQALHRKTDWRRHVRLLDEEEDRPGRLLSDWLVRWLWELSHCMRARLHCWPAKKWLPT